MGDEGLPKLAAMKKPFLPPLLARAIPLVCGLALAGVAAAEPPAMSKNAYEAAKDHIEAQYKADRKFCGGLKDHLQELCQAQARGKADAAKAELEARYDPSPEATLEARRVIAEANYKVDKVECEAKRDDDARDRCIDMAKAAREAAVRQAKVEKVQATGGYFSARKR
jgi:hypothetical protein